MPRIAREKSESGIYHIILRGANRQEIFHNDEDFVRYLRILDEYKKKTEFKLHGWCIMGNHIHLLLEEGKEDLGITMKRIGVSYVWFYNWKYQTTGHLFQDRYRSEKVDSNEYMLTVIRYIHQNPVKAGLVKRAEDWKWSSCAGYYTGKAYPLGMLDTDFVLGLFSKDRITSAKLFREFNEIGNEDKCMDDDVRIRLTDKEAREMIRKFISGYEIAAVKSLPNTQRNEFFKQIRESGEVTIRQAARILGVSTYMIFKA